MSGLCLALQPHVLMEQGSAGSWGTWPPPWGSGWWGAQVLALSWWLAPGHGLWCWSLLWWPRESRMGGWAPRLCWRRCLWAPLAEPAVGQPVDAWTAGACVDTLSTWGPELAVGLAVELPGVCWEGLCVPIGAWAVMTGPVVG